MPDLVKQIIGGIISGMVIAVWAFAFFSITDELKKVSPSNETTQAIENTEKAVSDSIKWYHIVGGISVILGLIFAVLWILDQFGLLDVFRQGSFYI